MSKPLPSRTFDTLEVQQASRFVAYHDRMSPIYDVAPAADAAAGFAARMTAHHLGDMLVGQSRFEAHELGRGAGKIARSGVDHILVQLYLEGGLVADTDGRQMDVQAGDLCLVDLGRPLIGKAQSSRTIDVILPRQKLVDMLKWHAPHGVVLKGDSVMATLLRDFLFSLRRQLDHLGPETAGFAVRATADLISTCFRSEATAAPMEPFRMATLERVKRHIEQHLASSALSPETIARELKLSRSYLYRLFENEGGVASYIRQRRLKMAYELLTNPRAGGRIGEIAYGCGFSSESHFNRVFRATFDATPGDVRRQEAEARERQAGSAPKQQVWLSSLR